MDTHYSARLGLYNAPSNIIEYLPIIDQSSGFSRSKIRVFPMLFHQGLYYWLLTRICGWRRCDEIGLKKGGGVFSE
jgi:hypothetical protein